MQISRWKFCLWSVVRYLILSLRRVFIESEVAKHYTFFSICIKICCSASQSCLTLCDPIDCNMPDFPCPSLFPRVCSNSRPLSWWGHSNHLVLCHPLLLLPSVFPIFRVFSNTSALRIRWPKYWSFSFSISPSNECSGWFPLGLTGLISLQSKELSGIFYSKVLILQDSAFFMVQLSHPHMTAGRTIVLTKWTFVGKVMSLLFNTLSRFVIAFLPRSKHLLISWLQSLSAVILEPKKMKSVTVSIVSPCICHEVGDRMPWS